MKANAAFIRLPGSLESSFTVTASIVSPSMNLPKMNVLSMYSATYDSAPSTEPMMMRACSAVPSFSLRPAL